MPMGNNLDWKCPKGNFSFRGSLDIKSRQYNIIICILEDLQKHFGIKLRFSQEGNPFLHCPCVFLNQNLFLFCCFIFLYVAVLTLHWFPEFTLILLFCTVCMEVFISILFFQYHVQEWPTGIWNSWHSFKLQLPAYFDKPAVLAYLQCYWKQVLSF